MQYREYDKTGIKVSALGFGCMRFPTERGHVKEEETIKILHRAIDLGVNYLDSAVMYCNNESETVLGKAIKGRRDNLNISTKNHYKGDDRGQWRRFLDQSLQRLGIDHIDFYHLHDLRLREYTDHLLPNGSMDEARKAKERGLIRHLCFSSHDEPENIIKLIDTDQFEGMLVQYNLLDQCNKETITYAHKKGLGVAVMGPVGGGRLVPPSEKVQTMAGRDAECTPEIAIRFVLSNPNVTVALSGMSSIKMVEENVTTASRSDPPSQKEAHRVLDILEKNRRLEGLYCTGCNYCMPCPNDIDIPANFSALNLFRVWGLEKLAKRQYAALVDRKRDGEPVPGWAEACIECGECESKCPQNIPIGKRLREVSKALSPNNPV
ncbi:MAG: aldo/keto reductase [Dehalococcoidia bacterium]|nr:aldo/keto reductase [Dehalococcoidia bacterium]TKJ46844.1 MAG: aldo/keto reductase [Candidatus Aerophobetes bacterium Ae_b3a]